MKTILFILTSFISTISFADIAKKVVLYDVVTKKAINNQFFYILKDNDFWVTIEETNHKGVAKIDKWWKYDSSATYQIDIKVKGYRNHRQTINLLDKNILRIGLMPDTNSFPIKSNMIYQDCYCRSFGNYYPSEASSLNDLPIAIKKKLETHLQDRLGEFYLKLRFSGGQIIDLNRLYKVYENARDFKWTPYSYYLCFSFADTVNGIAMFTSKIVLDSIGNVIEDIELPLIKNNPGKAKIISLYQATEIAKKYDFNSSLNDIKFYYDMDSDEFIWCFSRMVDDNGLTFSIETLILNAHNGNKIEIKRGGGIR